MIDGDLWRVHADEQSWTSDRRERLGEAFVETAAPLDDDLEAGGNPWAGRAVEGEDAGRRRRRFDNGQRLFQSCGRDRRRLLGCARRAESSLDPTGPWRLGDHEQRDVDHRSRRDMSRTVRAVPPTVPVTFDRPTRGS